MEDVNLTPSHRAKKPHSTTHSGLIHRNRMQVAFEGALQVVKISRGAECPDAITHEFFPVWRLASVALSRFLPILCSKLLART